MAKIRGIKPDYWTDEDITDLSIAARLLFIGLWTYACDNGHLQDKPKQIKVRVLPADDVSASDLLRELAGGGRIERADGWITIPNFTKHQKPDKRYFQFCAKPGCDPESGDSQPKTRGGHVESTTRPPRALVGDSLGPPGDGDVFRVDGDGDGERSRKPTPRKRATQLPDDFKPTEKHHALAAQQRVSLDTEWAKFCDYHHSKGSTMKDWSAALNGWIRKAAEFSGNVRAIRPSEPDEQGRVVLPPLPKSFWEQ